MDILFDDITIQTMADLEKTQKEFWNIPRQVGIFLNTLIKTSNSKNVLEIGTSNGYSGLWISKALKATGGRLTTIEYYEKRQSVAINNFEECGVADIITPLQGDACEILQNFDKDIKFDLVFIDANKSEYVKYFEIIKPHLTTHSIIVADNIISHLQKVQPFIKAIDDDNDFQYQIIEFQGGILVAYKNN